MSFTEISLNFHFSLKFSFFQFSSLKFPYSNVHFQISFFKFPSSYFPFQNSLFKFLSNNLQFSFRFLSNNLQFSFKFLSNILQFSFQSFVFHIFPQIFISAFKFSYILPCFEKFLIWFLKVHTTFQSTYNK